MAHGHPSDQVGPKRTYLALILSIVLGVFGADRFYLGYKGAGILKFVTFGGLGIWWIIDIVLIATRVMRDSDGHKLRFP